MLLRVRKKDTSLTTWKAACMWPSAPLGPWGPWKLYGSQFSTRSALVSGFCGNEHRMQRCLGRFSISNNLPAEMPEWDLAAETIYLLLIKVTTVNFTGWSGSREVEKEERDDDCLNLILSRHEIHILNSWKNWEKVATRTTDGKKQKYGLCYIYIHTHTHI